MAVGEFRIIKLAIPFKARQLLLIWEQHKENQKAFGTSGAVTPATTSALNKHVNRQGEGRLVPIYLKRIARETKDTIFTRLLGESTEAVDGAGRGAALGANDELKGDVKDPSKEAEASEIAAENIKDRSDLEEVYNVDCLLEVECLGVKQRIAPKADGP